MRRRYDKALDGMVLDLFDRGNSVQRIATVLDAPRGSVTRVVRAKYPEWDGRRVLPVKELIKRYANGETIEALSKDFDVSHKMVRDRLTESGVELRTQSEYQRKHFFNDDFFEKIDTEEKAYWLGFIFADGNVSRRMKDVAIALDDKDAGHLEKFGTAIGYSGPGIVVKCLSPGGSFHTLPHTYSKVCLRSSKMASDLVDKGCIPNKTQGLAPPCLAKSLRKHFIRGVVDGDGYISGRGIPSLEIVGAHALLDWIAKELDIPSPRPHKSIWRIRCSGTKARDKVRLLYQDASVALDRKLARAEKMF